ncbi:hypothetical protein Desaci_2584 [Desulfosporosinus acidiphilus SJ4]|uniref:SurA-like protein n=1 Tax=Desulfosporosinus acidiphilus (strain DSM 22704 / JCM 16185 / SJ4) TaxID=646529 RepID=I4D6U7_DESAJ|nr:SurA N-terminal domain-containing protein [Desulfosporosinus acidiphilus]AFM41521.1 hypothetical protein Desaci_2584 [Desulfosporosinus acidiphilus SJ4]
MKRILVSIVLLLLLSQILIGCGQKAEQQVPTNILKAVQSMTSQNNSHTQIAQPIVGSTTNIAIPDLKNIKNTKYPNVVAEVGDTKITGLQLTREVLIKQNDFVNNIKKPQDEFFYEKIALGLLVKNALIDNEVMRQGLQVTPDEASSYLEQQKKSMDSLPDSDPAKKAYTKTINDNGFSTSTDYINSPETIKFTQILLGRVKLRNLVLHSIPAGQNEAYKTWQDYTDKLINQVNYKIFIPVDIKGYQQLEEQTAKGK